MKIVLQRVSRAEVSADGASLGSIGRGHVLLVGFGPEDDEDALSWMVGKVLDLRVFPDDQGRMNRSLVDIGGDLLVVSQFTLYGDVRKGRRPSFVGAAPPQQAEARYDRFVALLRERAPARVETGSFGAVMRVELVNDGPVTLLLESP